MKRVLAAGDVNVDMVVEIPGDLTREHPKAELFGGGTIGNTAAGIARLGRPVSFLGKIGADAYGRFLEKDFGTLGVDTRYLLKEPDNFTIMVMAFIDNRGERHNITWPASGGAQFLLHTRDFPSEIWENTGWFHSSGIIFGESPARETILELMEEAVSRNIPVSFDLNLRLEYFGWRPGIREALKKAVYLSDYVFASLQEEVFPFTGESDIDTGIEKLLSLGRENLTLIARRGEQGALLCQGTERESIPSRKVEVLDTLGAGDAFNAGFITARMEGFSLKDSVLRGHGCAGFNLTKKGARGLPSRSELELFMRESP